MDSSSRVISVKISVDYNKKIPSLIKGGIIEKNITKTVIYIFRTNQKVKRPFYAFYFSL